MGKGDKKSRRGKIHIGSYGKRRPRPKSNSMPEKVIPVIKEKPVKASEPVVKKVAKAAEVAEVVEPVAESTVTKKAPRKTTKKTKEEPAAE